MLWRMCCLSGHGVSHLLRLVGSPFFHIGVLFFLESQLLTFLPALQLFPRISFLLSTVICWWLGRRWTVLFLSAVHLLSLPLHLLIMLLLSLA